MGGRGSAGRAGTATASTPKTLDDRVEQAYQDLAGKPGDTISLVRLRDKLGDVPRSELDAKLREMDRARKIQLDPDPNRMRLTEQAKAAAIQLGGQDMHLITFLR